MAEQQYQQLLSGALRLTNLQQVATNVVEGSQNELQQLVHQLPGQSDADRKQALLLHLHGTRQRLLRLLVVSQWANKAKAVVECGKVLDVTARHAHTLSEAADKLVELHEELENTRTPIFDVPTALDVLQTGSYNILPQIIEDLRPPVPPPPRKRRAAVRLLDQLLRSQLLKEDLPLGVEVVTVSGGSAVLRSEGEYEAKLTLVPAPPLPLPNQDPPASQPLEDGAADQDTAATGQAPAQQAQQGQPAASGLPPQQPQQAQQQQPGPTQKGQMGQSAAVGAAAVEGPSEAAQQPLENGNLALDIDVGGVSQDGAGASGAVAGPATDTEASSRKPEKWRWRLLSFTMLPGYSDGRLLWPQQSSQLQAAIESRMWAAANVLAQRSMHGLPAEHAEPSTSQPAQQAAPQTLPQASGSRQGAESASGRQSVASASGMLGDAIQQQASTPQQVDHPLQIMHNVLQGVAGRLLLNEAVTAVRALLASGGRWHGHARMDTASHYSTGIRLSYWLQVPCHSPSDFERLLSSHYGRAPAAGPAAPAATSAASVAAATASSPAVEIGIGADGHVSAIAVPQLWWPDLERLSRHQCEAPQAPQEAQQAQQAQQDLVMAEAGDDQQRWRRDHLALAVHHTTADAEHVMLQAAACNAHIQLAALALALESRGRLAAQNATSALRSAHTASHRPFRSSTSARAGEASQHGPPIEATSTLAAAEAASASPPSAAAVPSGALPTPELQLCHGGAVLLTVKVQLHTGRFLLRSAEVLEGEASLDSAAQLKQEEEKLAAIQNAALRDRAVLPAGTTPVQAATERIAAALEDLTQKRLYRDLFAQLVAAARALGLHAAPLSARTLRAFMDANPFAPKTHAPNAILAFSPPPQLPAIMTSAPTSALTSANASSATQQPGGALWAGLHGLAFYLVADVVRNAASRALRWQYSLVMCSCNARGLVLQVLKMVQVPAILPDLEVDDGGHRAHMAAVIRWCQERMVWEQLRLHLQLLDLPYSEELTARPSKAQASNLAEVVDPRPARPPLQSSAETSGGPAEGPAADELVALDRSMWLDSFRMLEQLDAALPATASSTARGAGAAGGGSAAAADNTAAAAGTAHVQHSTDGDAAMHDALQPASARRLRRGKPTGMQLRLHGPPSAAGQFSAGVHSSYLAQLPASFSAGASASASWGQDQSQDQSQDQDQPQDQPQDQSQDQSRDWPALPSSSSGQSADVGRSDAHIQQTEHGLQLSYSLALGHTAASAIVDVLRVTRLHAFLHRARSRQQHLAAKLADLASLQRRTESAITMAPGPEAAATAGNAQPQLGHPAATPAGDACQGNIRGTPGAESAAAGAHHALAKQPSTMAIKGRKRVTTAGKRKAAEANGSVDSPTPAAADANGSLDGVHADGGPLKRQRSADGDPPAADARGPARVGQAGVKAEQTADGDTYAADGSGPARVGQSGVKVEQTGAAGASTAGQPPAADDAFLDATDPAVLWRLYGSGVVRVTAVGPTAAVLSVLPDMSPSAAVDQSAARQDEPDPVPEQTSPAGLEIRVSWVATTAAQRAEHAQHGSQAGTARCLRSGSRVAGAKHAAPLGTGPEADAAEVALVRCQVELRPQLPAPVLRVLEEMADEGEEALLLDALCIVGPPLLAVLRTLQPEQLLRAGLVPADVTLAMPNAPYKAQMAVHQGGSIRLLVKLQFCGFGLTWLALDSAAGPNAQVKQPALQHIPGGAAPQLPAQGPGGAAEQPESGSSTAAVLASLLPLPGVYPADGTAPGAASLPAVGASNGSPLSAGGRQEGVDTTRGVWVRTSVLGAVIEALLGRVKPHAA